MYPNTLVRFEYNSSLSLPRQLGLYRTQIILSAAKRIIQGTVFDQYIIEHEHRFYSSNRTERTRTQNLKIFRTRTIRVWLVDTAVILMALKHPFECLQQMIGDRK